MYELKRDIPYVDLTGQSVCPEALPGGWNRANWVDVNNYPWDESGYTPEAHAAASAWNGGLCVMMLAREESISGTVREVGGGVCVDSCLECFVQPFPDDPRYFNIEVNCLGTAHIAIGEGREGRRVWKQLPAGARVSASAHADGWWAMSAYLPASLLAECFSGRTLEPGAPLKGNFYKCDETIHPHFGTWNPVVAPQPDFHRPECFGDMRVER